MLGVRAASANSLSARAAQTHQKGNAALWQLDFSAAGGRRKPAREPGRGTGNENRRRRLAAQFLQLAHRPLDALLGGVTVLLHGLSQARSLDFEADRKRAHVGQNL